MNISELFQSLLKRYIANHKHGLHRPDFNLVTFEIQLQATNLIHNAKSIRLCKDLIALGANLNDKDKEGRTPLHNAILHGCGSGVIRELLRSGANPHAWDNYKCSPLIMAIKLLGKDALDVVRELLKYGANPDVHDFQGYSALILAIYKKDLNLIQELLEWGADINFQSKSPFHIFNFYLTPMTEAFRRDEECAKLLIKMTVMKYFDNNFLEMINLNPLIDANGFIKLSYFLAECAKEVPRIKSFLINKKYSLFDFVVNSRKCFKPLYCDDRTIRKISSHFSIYKDIILTNIQSHLIRAQLLSKLRSLRLYVSVYHYEGGCEEISLESFHIKEVYLNADCSCKIAEYLPNDDLSAFIKAYQ